MAINLNTAKTLGLDILDKLHRRLEAGGLEGKLVLCPDLSSRRDRQL